MYNQVFPKQGISVVGKPVPELRVLDVGACLGTDLRQMMVDGVQNVQGLDIEPQFFPIGTKLWTGVENVTEGPEKYLSDHLYPCDMLDSSLVQRVAQQRFPEGVDVIYSGAVLHLFSMEECLRFALNLFQIASLRRSSSVGASGSGVLFGRTIGSTGRPFSAPRAVGDSRRSSQLKYLHGIESLKSLFESVGFTDVVVQTAASDYPQDNAAHTMLEGRAAMLHFSARF